MHICLFAVEAAAVIVARDTEIHIQSYKEVQSLNEMGLAAKQKGKRG